MSRAPDDARLVRSGTFKLDRSRAIDKLAHFQLADPRDYVRELVAAAVCAGATEIWVRNDSDDFEVEWDGAHPELDDLSSFFDAIFHRGSDRHVRMLQHLAQGVLGALGIEPRWVRLIRPGLTLDLTDPKNPKSIENDRKQGVRVEVRERLGLKVLWEWGRKPFAGPEELIRLRSVALGCPVPIVVDGHPLDLDLPRHLSRPSSGVVQVERSDPACTGEMWFATEAPRSEAIRLMRDGVQVDHNPVDLCGAPVTGYLRCDALRLDASQSSVMEDATWQAVVDALRDGVRRLVRNALSNGNEPPDSRTLRLARELVSGPKGLLADIPLFDDLRGQLWSLKALADAPRVLVAEDAELFDETLDLPQLTGDSKLFQRMHQWLPGRVRHGATELRERGVGRARRASLTARIPSFAVDAPYTHAIEADRTRMRIGVSPEGADWNDIIVEFWVDGLPVVRTHQHGPGPVMVRVEHNDLTANDAFSQVVPDSLRAQLEERATRAAVEAVRAAVVEHPRHPDIRALFRRHLHQAMHGTRRGTGASVFPPPLRQVAFFPHRPLGLISLDRIESEARSAGRLDSRGRELAWFVPDSQPPLDPNAHVLQLAPPDVHVLQRVFAGRLVHVGQRLANTAEASRRRREGRAEAQLPVHVSCVETRELDLPSCSLTGIAGVRADPDAVGCLCIVVREGVLLGELDLPVNLPGVIVAVEWDEAEPLPDWSHLADPDSASLQLAEKLEASLLDLVRSAAAELPDLLGPLPDWLVALLMRGPRHAAELADRPFVRSANGKVRLLGQPVKRQQGGRGGLHLLPPGSSVPEHLCDRFHIADADHQRILRVWHGGRDVRDGHPQLEEYRAKHRRFRQRSPLPWCLPNHSVHGARHADTGLEVWIGMDGRHGATHGVDMSVRYESRELERSFRKGAFPWRVVARGARVHPNETYTACADVDVVTQIAATARTLRAEALEQLACDIASPEATEAHLRLGAQVLLQLLRSQVQWLGTSQRQRLLDQLENTALFVDVTGSRHTLDALRVAHAEGRLGALRQLPDGAAPPNNTIWLFQESSTDPLLHSALGSRPFDATGAAVQQARGMRRWTSAPRSPLVEPGHHVAEKVLGLTLAGIEGEGQMWVALSPGQVGERRYRVDGRVVTQDRLTELPGVRVAIEHPALKPTSGFDNVGPHHVVHAVRRASIQAVYELLDGVLNDRPPAEVVDLAVRILSTQRRGTPPLKADPAVLAVSHGPPLPLSALRTITTLRFAPEGTTGRPLQGKAPVFVGRPARRTALETWGPVTDSTESLAREEAAWSRRCGELTSTRLPSNVIASCRVPAPRSGRLYLVKSSRDGVVVRVNGRALTTRAVGAPLPLIGTVDDPAVRADPWFERIADRKVEAQLDHALKECAEALLLELMARRTPPRAVLLQSIVRSFSGKADILRAGGARAQLAQHDLFEVGTTGEHCSLLELAQTPGGPRLHSGSYGYNSLDDSRPLVRVPKAHIGALLKLLDGIDASRFAAEEHIAARRREAPPLPFALEGARWLAVLKGARGRSKWVAGLHTDTEQRGRVDIRVRGRPAGSISVHAPGLHAIVELDPRKVRPLDPTPEPNTNVLRAILHTYPMLIDAAGDALVAGPARIQRLCRVVHSVHRTLRKGKLPAKRAWQRPWLEAPLLAGTDGQRHTIGALCRVVAGDGLVLWATSDSTPEADLLLTQDALNQAVIDVLGWSESVQSTHAWHAERDRLHAEKEATKNARARTRRIQSAQGKLQQFAEALHSHRRNPTACAERSVRRATPDELLNAPDFPTLATLAWRLADAESLTQSGGPRGVDVVDQLAAFLVHRLGDDRDKE